MAPLKNISGCVSFFDKMSRLTLYLENESLPYVFGEVQGTTSTGNLHDEYL